MKEKQGDERHSSLRATLLASEPVEAMAEEEEVEKYKRLFEEQKARVKDLERQNAQLKVRVYALQGTTFLLVQCCCVSSSRVDVRQRLE